jgi:hypothetical protein
MAFQLGDDSKPASTLMHKDRDNDMKNRTGALNSVGKNVFAAEGLKWLSILW